MLDTFPEDARACDFTACWPCVTCWTPRPREHAALCNDLGDSEVRKHEDETPAKTRHPDDCEVTQTGSFRGCNGARQLPLTPFGSPSSHKASGIVRLEGDQTPSRQLFGSSRFGRVRRNPPRTARLRRGQTRRDRPRSSPPSTARRSSSCRRTLSPRGGRGSIGGRPRYHRSSEESSQDHLSVRSVPRTRRPNCRGPTRRTFVGGAPTGPRRCARTHARARRRPRSRQPIGCASRTAPGLLKWLNQSGM